MHIQKLRIQNIRSITDLEIKIAKPYAGWHVILGDNGSGKSSVIRALALVLIGSGEAAATRQDWNQWIRRGASSGQISVELPHDSDFDRWVQTGRQSRDSVKLVVGIDRFSGSNSVRAFPTKRPGRYAARTVWGGGKGWFSASFGPFRRFSGGDKEYDRLFHSNPKLAPHLSAFGEAVALGEALRWLQDLQFKRYEQDQAATRLLNGLLQFLGQSGWLPHGARIGEITSEAVTFIDGAGISVPVEELSDGFRSVLSMTFELLRGMVVAYGESEFLNALDEQTGSVKLPGVVAIDEIDAHLHPAWQQVIGEWLVSRFPMIQFFVTTHSPIICRSAAKGSIWRLPTPGRDEMVHRIEGVDRRRLVNGSILDAFDTEYFGEKVTRSDASHEMMKKLATLNMKSLRSSLSDKERIELEELRSTLPSLSALSE